MVAGRNRFCDHHHSVGAAIHSMGRMAVPNRRDLYLLLLVSCLMDRPFFPMACGRDLSAKFYLANLDSAGRNHPRLAVDEDAELHPDPISWWRAMGGFGLGFQLHSAGALSSTCAVHAPCLYGL